MSVYLYTLGVPPFGQLRRKGRVRSIEPVYMGGVDVGAVIEVVPVFRLPFSGKSVRFPLIKIAPVTEGGEHAGIKTLAQDQGRGRGRGRGEEERATEHFFDRGAFQPMLDVARDFLEKPFESMTLTYLGDDYGQVFIEVASKLVNMEQERLKRELFELRLTELFDEHVRAITTPESYYKARAKYLSELRQELWPESLLRGRIEPRRRVRLGARLGRTEEEEFGEEEETGERPPAEGGMEEQLKKRMGTGAESEVSK